MQLSNIQLLFGVLTLFFYAQCGIVVAQNSGGTKHNCVVVGHVLDMGRKMPIPKAKVYAFNEITGKIDSILTNSEGLYAFNLGCTDYFVFHAQTENSLHKSELVPLSTNMNSIQYKNLWIDLPTKEEFHATTTDSLHNSSLFKKLPPPNNFELFSDATTFVNRFTYSVEIGVFSNMPNTESFFGNPIRDDLMIENLPNNEYRFTIGVFKNYGDATPFLAEIRAKGYQNARIIAYWGDIYIEVLVNDLLLFLEKQ